MIKSPNYMGMSFSPGRKWAAETHLEEIMSKIASVFWDKNYLRGWIQGLFLFWQKVAFGISSERLLPFWGQKWFEGVNSRIVSLLAASGLWNLIWTNLKLSRKNVVPDSLLSDCKTNSQRQINKILQSFQFERCSTLQPCPQTRSNL